MTGRQKAGLVAAVGGLALAGVVLVVRSQAAAATVGVVRLGAMRLTSQCQTLPAAVPLGAHLELSVPLSNGSSQPATLAMEAVLVDTNNQNIAGLWYATTHPSSGSPSQDDPAWYTFLADIPPQARASVPTGSAYPCGEFGTVFEGYYAHPLQTVLYAAAVPSDYTGPVVTGKVIGAPLSALTPAPDLTVVEVTGPSLKLQS